MRRHALHIAAALLAFTVGFLTTEKLENLIFALPLALSVFVFAEGVPRLRLKLPTTIDSHKLLVAAITLLLWIPLLAVFLPLIFQVGGGFGNCTLDFHDAVFVSNAVEKARPFTLGERPEIKTDGDCCCSCYERLLFKPKALIDAGVVNKKAVSLPALVYQPLLKSASVSGPVVVSVIIDAATGRVVWAEAISGHPLLRQAARDAACKTRFSPTFMDGKPVLARGILTYNFTF
ncbi:MAG TPA: energy transducer TonB [Pyrinomonadaceae bacterium]|nr:energy transducer TonB [Pyrinomonadaceae bacterium]